jgi:flagellar hook-associated protein 2
MSSLGMSGVFSGIDTDTLVARIMAINTRPVALMEIRKGTWEEKISAIDTIESRLAQLKSLADQLHDSDTLVNVIASSSDSTVVTATASGGAIEGNYSVEINQLAAGHRMEHTDGLASADTTLGSSKSTALNVNSMADADATWFTTSANGATYTFDFGDEADMTEVVFAADTTYSLNQVAALINVRSQAVAGYDAAVVEEDAGQYYLRMTAQDPGPVGELTHTLTVGDAIAELNDAADWTKDDGAGGTFIYTYDGVTRTINTGDGTTLSDLVGLINNDAENPGVSASLLQYDGGNGVYHLVLSGKTTGEDYGITIDAGTTLMGFNDVGSNWTVTQQAQNAQVRVDGFPAGAWIERSTNTISDVIPDVTLTLVNTTATGESEMLTLTRSTSGLEEDLENLVAIYNGLVDTVDEYAGYDDENETSGILQGNVSVTTILTQMRMILSGTAAGFVAGTDAYTMFSDIGIEFDAEGKLELDTDILNDAIDENFDGVLSLIGALSSGTTDDDYIKFTSAEESTQAGTYEISVSFNAGGEITQALIRTKGDTVWRNATWDGSTITCEDDDNPEKGLIFSAVWDGVSSTQTAELRILRGFAGMIYDHMDTVLDDETGTVSVMKEGFQNQISSLEDAIETQTKRLEQQEEHLRAKFARLEATLAKLDAQRGAVDSLLQAFSTNND